MLGIELSLSIKPIGQVNPGRYGFLHVSTDENPSFTLVSGVLSTNPIPGSAAISMANSGVQWVRAGRGA